MDLRMLIREVQALMNSVFSGPLAIIACRLLDADTGDGLQICRISANKLSK
jgi:hypothetical protein